MMNNYIKKVVVCLVFLYSSSSLAALPDSKADQLLELSGFTNQISQFPGMIKAGLQQSAQQQNLMEDAKLAKVNSAIDKTIDPQVIIKLTRQALKKQIDEKTADQVIAWYKTDIGQKITNAETAASTLQAYNEMMASTQELLEKTERVNLAKRIDKLTKSTEAQYNIQQHVSIAVYSALMKALQPDQKLDVEGYEKQLELMRPQMMQSIEKLVTLLYVYAYQDISSKELKDYEEFLATPAAKKFHEVTIESASVGLEKVFDDFAAEFAKALK